MSIDILSHLDTLKHAPCMEEVIWKIKRALEKGRAPERSRQGTTQTYFLKDSEDHPIAVFKLNHAIEEYAAFRLDHDRFAQVPPTVITMLDHPIWGGEKTGSCQLFIQKAIPVVQLGLELYDPILSQSLRRIATLDIRVMNGDRHTSNLLVHKGAELIPIDHGLILPKEVGECGLVWTHWRQAATAFSEEEVRYIASLDPEEDRSILMQELHFKEDVANRVYVATMLLKRGVSHKLTAGQIGYLMKPNKLQPSSFQSLIERLKERNARNWTIFTQYVYEEIDRLLKEVKP